MFSFGHAEFSFDINNKYWVNIYIENESLKEDSSSIVLRGSGDNFFEAVVNAFNSYFDQKILIKEIRFSQKINIQGNSISSVFDITIFKNKDMKRIKGGLKTNQDAYLFFIQTILELF